DANFDGKAWQVSRAVAELHGNTSVLLTGTARNVEDRPNFNGTIAVSSARLDAFSHLCRRASKNDPLIHMPGRLEGQISIACDVFSLNHGRLTLNGKVHAVELRLDFGDEKRFVLVGRFDDPAPADSAALGSLFPYPASDGLFG